MVEFDDTQKMKEMIEHLTADNVDSTVVYAGKYARELARQHGIPEEVWEKDRVSLQAGQKLMAEELKEGIPEPEQQAGRIRKFLGNQIEAKFQILQSDMDRKNLLLGMLMCSGLCEQDNLTALSHASLPDLKAELIERVMSIIEKEFVPALKNELISAERNQEKQTLVVRDSTALAVISYMNSPDMRKYPVFIGGVAEGISGDQPEEADDDSRLKNLLKKVIFVLLLMVGVLVLMALGEAAAGLVVAAIEKLVESEAIINIGEYIIHSVANIDFIKVAKTAVTMVKAVAKIANFGEVLKSFLENHNLTGEKPEVINGKVGQSINVNIVVNLGHGSGN